MSQLDTLLANEPNNTRAYSERAKRFVVQGQFDQALADLTAAIVLDPDTAEYYGNRGVVYRLQGNYDAATEDFYKVMELKPNMARAYFDVGETLRQAGRLRESLDYYEQALAMDPDYEKAKLQKVLANRALEQRLEAERVEAEIEIAKQKEAAAAAALAAEQTVPKGFKLGHADPSQLQLAKQRAEQQASTEPVAGATAPAPAKSDVMQLRPLGVAAGTPHDGQQPSLSGVQAVQKADPASLAQPTGTLRFSQVAQQSADPAERQSNPYIAQSGSDATPTPESNPLVQDQPEPAKTLQADVAQGNAAGQSREAEPKPQVATTAPALARRVVRPAAGDAQPAMTKPSSRAVAEPVSLPALTQQQQARLAELTRRAKANPNSAEAFGRRGAFYLEHGRLTEALADFDTVVRLSPRSSIAYCDRALAQIEAGAYDQAVLDCDQALEINPSRSEAYQYRAQAYLQLQAYDSTIADCDKLLEIDPNSQEAHSARGLAYLNQGHYAKAVADFNFAIRLNPDDDTSYYNRGIAYGGTQDTQAALASFTKAIELNPKYVEAYGNRGIAYLYCDEVDLALADFDQVIALNPREAKAYYSRGKTYQQADKNSLALADFAKSAELDPDFAEAHYEVGLAKAEAGDHADAIGRFTTVIQLQPQSWPAYFERASSRAAIGQSDLATADIQRTLELNPQYEPGLELLASLPKASASPMATQVAQPAEAVGNSAVAVEPQVVTATPTEPKAERKPNAFALTKDPATKVKVVQEAEVEVVQLEQLKAKASPTANTQDGAVVSFADPSEPEVSPTQQVQRLVQQGNWPEVVKACDAWIAKDPSAAPAFAMRGTAQLYMSQFDAAIADFDKALKLDPNYAEAYGNRAIAQLYQGKTSEAFADYGHAVRLDSQNPKVYVNRARGLSLCWPL